MEVLIDNFSVYGATFDECLKILVKVFRRGGQLDFELEEVSFYDTRESCCRAYCV